MKGLFLVFVIVAHSFVQQSLCATYHTVSVYGEPKSGTSWLGVIIDKALHVLCEDYRHYIRYRNIQKTLKKYGCLMLPRRGDARASLTYMVGKRQMKFTLASKHHVPDVKNTFSCMHGNWHPTTSSPCGLVNDNSTATPSRGSFAATLVPQPSELTTCLHTCYAPPSPTKQATYIHIIRDPRDVSVSSCYYNDEVNRRYNGSLTSCLLATFPKVLLWTKFREMIFAQPATKAMGPLLCYEELTSKYEQVVKDAYSVIISALADKSGGNFLSNHKLTSLIVGSTSESALRRTNRTTSRSISSKTRHKRSGNIAIDVQASKLRADGGANRHYTSYYDEIGYGYGDEGKVVSQRLLQWMNNSFSLFERYHPSPCRTHREAVGLH